MRLYQMIDPVALFTIAVIDHGIIEIIYVPAGLPRGGMHKNSGIDTDYILTQLGHALPPVVLYILFELAAHLTIIVDSLQSIVDLTAGKNKSVLFGMRNYCLKQLGIIGHSMQI